MCLPSKPEARRLKDIKSVCSWRKSVFRAAAEESMVRYLHIRHFARILLPLTERHLPEDERKVF